MLSPMGYQAFKRTFLDPENKECLANLLHAIIDIPQEDFDGFEIINSLPVNDVPTQIDIDRSNLNEQNDGFTCAIKLKNNTRIVVVVHVGDTPYLTNMITVRFCELLADRLYTDASPACFAENHVLLISDRDIVAIEDILPKFYARFTFSSTATNEPLDDRNLIHVLSILDTPDKNDGTLKWQWGKFFQGQETEEFKMIIEENPAIKKAYDTIREMSQNEQEQLYNDAILALMQK